MRAASLPLRGKSAAALLRPAAAAALALALFSAHQRVVALPPTATSALVPLARLFDVGLLGGALLLAHALGARLLRALRLTAAPAEGAAYATGLGLGALAYAALALGFLGLYRPPVLLAAVALAAILLRRDLATGAAGLLRAARRAREVAGTMPRGVPVLVVLLAGATLLALLGALTPPHHYDPLSYHLVAPERYLQTGHIAPLPHLEYANLPFTAEVLYGVGLAFGSLVFGQLLHLAFGGVTALALWALARRRFDGPTAWLALAVFLATPLVTVWARVADVDLALACYVLLMLAAALRAYDDDAGPAARRWLLLAGVCGGLALGTKYQALFVVPVLALLFAIDGAWRLRRGVRAVAGDIAVFLGAAAVVAAPWYAKNWLALGNPLWPLFFGGRDLGAGVPALLTYYARGMALSPRTIAGYLALPLQVYLRGDIEQRFAILSPLFVLLPALVALPRRRDLGYCLILSAAIFAGWAAGFQELRYLLPLCAPLALATAYVLRAARARRGLRRAVRPALIACALLTLGVTALQVGADRPVGVLLGRESQDAYLRQSITTGASYRALSFLAGRVRPGETVRCFDEAQVFYFDFPVEADHLNVNLLAVTEAHPDPADALATLRAEHVDYLLVNEANLRYAERFDPDGRLARGVATFARLTPRLDEVYRDGPTERPTIVIYRVRR
ncbi:MAG TPA: glycosyltransferase family 39 protein [Thermomicrobiales bacterium]|nr:glycosyltransferase family 39 protein [Thermomicrobiales bacterium]